MKKLILIVFIVALLAGCATVQCDPNNPPEGYVCVTEEEYAELIYAIMWMDQQWGACLYQLQQLQEPPNEETY